MTQKELNEAIEISVKAYGKEATIIALNKMFHDKMITIEQCIAALDTLNK